MSHIFGDCCSLTVIDLSNFITQNVIDISCMFYECNSLTNLNLSNFITQNVKHMWDMFLECESLKKKNIIAEDKKILDNFHKFQS